MTKNQIVDELTKRTGVSKVKVAEILDAIAELTYENAKDGFSLPGIGKVVISSRNARVCRNPKTGESINVPAKRVLKFRNDGSGSRTVFNCVFGTRR